MFNRVPKRWRLIALSITVIGLYPLVYFVGYVFGQRSAEVARCHNQRELIRPILASDAAYSEITVGDDCDGDHILLNGKINTERERSKLLDKLTRAIGYERAWYAVSGLVVVKPDRWFNMFLP